jgi:hypothetical protein
MSKQFEAAFDGPAFDGPALDGRVETTRKSVRERLRWPLMLALPIAFIAAGTVKYLNGER